MPENAAVTTTLQEVDYSQLGPDYLDSLFAVFDDAKDVLYLLVFSEDEVAAHDGEYWSTPNKETLAEIMDLQSRKVKKGLEEDLITAWESGTGKDADGSYFSIDQFTPFFP